MFQVKFKNVTVYSEVLTVKMFVCNYNVNIEKKSGLTLKWKTEQIVIRKDLGTYMYVSDNYQTLKVFHF